MSIAQSMGFSELYPNPIAYQDNLHQICKPKFGCVLYVNGEGRLTDTNVFHALIEIIKGSLSFHNGVDSDLVKQKTVEFLKQGADRHWIDSKEKLEEVRALGRRNGVIQVDTKKADGRRDEIDAVIQKISMELNASEDGRRDLNSSIKTRSLEIAVNQDQGVGSSEDLGEEVLLRKEPPNLSLAFANPIRPASKVIAHQISPRNFQGHILANMPTDGDRLSKDALLTSYFRFLDGKKKFKKNGFS